jgi:imidazolonepropionase-like amidohydrolase
MKILGFGFAVVVLMTFTGKSNAQPGHVVAITGATVIDGTGSPPLKDAVIVIENGRIASVGPRSGARVPDGAERKDLSGLTVLPGLIDSHVHISFTLSRSQ